MYGFNKTGNVVSWINVYNVYGLSGELGRLKTSILLMEHKIKNNIGNQVTLDIGQEVTSEEIINYINLYSNKSKYRGPIKFCSDYDDDSIHIQTNLILTDDKKEELEDLLETNKLRLENVLKEIKVLIEKKCKTKISYVNKHIDSNPKKMLKYKSDISIVRNKNDELKDFTDYAIYKIFIEDEIEDE